MSGSLYTPYPVAGQPTSGGQAFREGFLGAQQIETNVQELERRRQAARLAELQEQRSQQAELRAQAAEQRLAERFPLEQKQTAFNIQQRQLTAPIELERARFTLTEAQRAAADARAYERAVLEFLRSGNLPTGAATAPAPAQVQPGATPGLIMPQAPVTPAPTAPVPPAAPARLPVAPVGPQSSVDGRPSWLNADFGNRRFTGVQEARLGMSDAGPAGAEPGAEAPLPADLAQAGMPTESTRIAAEPPATGAAPSDPITAFIRSQSDDQLRQIIARGNRSFFGEPSAANVALAREASLTLRQRESTRTATPAEQAIYTAGGAGAPLEATAAAAAAATAATSEQTPPERGEELRFRPVGVRPPGEPSAQAISQAVNRRIDTLGATDTPTPLSALSPWQIGNEQRALAERETALERRRQALLVIARRDPTAALQAFTALETEAQAIALNRANLNGRIAISEFAAGNFAPLAQDMFTASGGRLRLEPRPDGTFNIWGPEGTQRPLRTGVQASEIINQGRLMYDANYQEQVNGIRQRAIARNEEIFKAHVRGLEEALKQEAQLSREQVIERVKQQAQAQFRGSNMQVTVDTNTGNIIYRDQNGVLPLRILRVVPRPDPTNPSRTRGFMTEEVEVGAAPGQQQVAPTR